MNSDLPYALPQPNSRHLRIIAGMIARRESDAACIDRITRFLEQCGVPVASIPPSWYDQISEKT